MTNDARIVPMFIIYFVINEWNRIWLRFRPSSLSPIHLTTPPPPHVLPLNLPLLSHPLSISTSLCRRRSFNR